MKTSTNLTQKTSIWFLLTLKTSAAYICQRKLCTETQISQLPKMVMGVTIRLQMKDILEKFFNVNNEFLWVVEGLTVR